MNCRLNAIKLRIYTQIVIPTKVGMILDSRFHGNDMNFFLNLTALSCRLGRVITKHFHNYYKGIAGFHYSSTQPTF